MVHAFMQARTEAADAKEAPEDTERRGTTNQVNSTPPRGIHAAEGDDGAAAMDTGTCRCLFYRLGNLVGHVCCIMLHNQIISTK
jgi:hypothetical protein